MHWLRFLCAGALAIDEPAPRAARHGGNERVLLVANGASGLSLALARRYAELRLIPSDHLLVLDDVPGAGPASAEPIALSECRDRILAPILRWLAERGLTNEIDAILFSTGFPHAVDVAAAAQDRKLDQHIGGVAALTGLTCFAREVVDNDLSCLSLDANRYCKSPIAPGADPALLTLQPSRGFGCDPQGRGHRYLSTVIAWIGPFGLPYDAAVAQLERSAAADGTNPRGTFYYLENEDVRATTRMPLFASAMRELAERGRKCELLQPGKGGQDGILPKGKEDVLGAVVGISDFDWATSGSTILPGAIVEHLTSCGGMLQAAGQTKLTAFLAAGAAGASGAVTEPYAIQAKFPTPFIHVHYVDGCSLAESFFQSVAGPYQLLIVGDACCRPFAKFAEIELPDPSAPRPKGASDNSWRGTVALAPTIRGDPIDKLEAWIDGKRVAQAPAGGELSIDTTSLDDGPHELHVVAVGPAPIGVASSIARRVTVGNSDASRIAGVTLTGPAKSVELGALLKLQGRAPAGAKLELFAGSRRLVEFAGGGAWRVELPTTALGPGRSELQLRATTAAGGVRSEFLEATVVLPTIATTSTAPGDPLPGLAVDVGAGKRRELYCVVNFGDALPIAARTEDPDRARAAVRGWVKLPAEGLHEWSVTSAALLSLSLDGKRLVVEPPQGIAARGASFAAKLAAGWHSFELELEREGASPPRLSLLGPAGPVSLGDLVFGHGPATLKRVPADKLKPKNAGWCDGNRTVAAPPAEGEPVELELAAGSIRIGAVLLFVAPGAADLDKLRERLTLEARDSAAWSPVSPDEVRIIRGSANGSPLVGVLWSVPGRRARRLRVKESDRGGALLSSLAEIEVWESTAAK